MSETEHMGLLTQIDALGNTQRLYPVTKPEAVEGLGDYVLSQGATAAQGTAGSWFWRKWFSGLAECWMRAAYEPVDGTSQGSVHYSASYTVWLPFPMTDTVITASASGGTDGGRRWICLSAVDGVTGGAGKSFAFRIATPTTPIDTKTTVMLRVAGRWK